MVLQECGIIAFLRGGECIDQFVQDKANDGIDFVCCLLWFRDQEGEAYIQFLYYMQIEEGLTCLKMGKI